MLFFIIVMCFCIEVMSSEFEPEKKSQKLLGSTESLLGSGFGIPETFPQQPSATSNTNLLAKKTSNIEGETLASDKQVVRRGSVLDQSIMNALELSHSVYKIQSSSKQLPKAAKSAVSGDNASVSQQPKGQLKNQVRFVMLPVFNQGAGAQCGYHALKNVLIFMLNESQNNLIDPLAYEEKMKIWGPIIAQRRKTPDISWLQGQEIDELIGPYQSVENPIIVLERLQGESQFTDIQLRPIQSLLSQDDAKLGIVWNVGGSGNHWVGLVAVKNQRTITIYHMDSIGRAMDRRDQEILRDLFASNPEEIIARNNELGMIHRMRNDLDKLQAKLNIFQNPNNDNHYIKYIGCENNEGTWRNSSGKAKRYKSGLDCSTMNQIYRGSWLVVGQKEELSVFYPGEMLVSIYNTCLVSWRDYQHWPEQIQRQITKLLIDYFGIASGNQKENMLTNLIAEEFDLMGSLEDILAKLPTTQAEHRRIRELAAYLIIGN